MHPGHPPHPLPRLFGSAAFPAAVSGLKITGGFGTLSLFFLGVVRALCPPGLTCLTSFGVEVACLGRPRPLLAKPEGPGTSESITTVPAEGLLGRELLLRDSSLSLSSLVPLVSELESSELESDKGAVVSGFFVWVGVALVAPLGVKVGLEIRVLWAVGAATVFAGGGCSVGFTRSFFAPRPLTVDAAAVVLLAGGCERMAGMSGGGSGAVNFVVLGARLAVDTVGLLVDEDRTTTVCLTGLDCLRTVRAMESTEILSQPLPTDLVTGAPELVMIELVRIWPGRVSPVCGAAVSADRCS